MSTGYGTYITAGLLLAATIAHAAGWLDDATFQSIMGALGASGLSFLRASVSASDAKTATGQAVIAEAVGVAKPEIAAKIATPAGVTTV